MKIVKHLYIYFSKRVPKTNPPADAKYTKKNKKTNNLDWSSPNYLLSLCVCAHTNCDKQNLKYKHFTKSCESQLSTSRANIYCGVSLTLCCFVVYSTRQFALCLTLFYFVLVFSVLLALRLPRLGKRKLILVLFVRLIDLNLSAFRTFVRFVLVWFCRFPLLFGVWEGLRFVTVALPGLFFYLFFPVFSYLHNI